MAEPSTVYKLIVLFMADKADDPLSNSQISEFILDHDYTDYLQLQQVLSELAETGLLHRRKISNSSYYEITPEGRKVLPYFEKDLSPEIQSEVCRYLKANGFEVPEKFLAPADCFKTEQGKYAVRLQIYEKGNTVFELTMTAPSQEAGLAMCDRWPFSCHDIYDMILDKLI